MCMCVPMISPHNVLRTSSLVTSGSRLPFAQCRNNKQARTARKSAASPEPYFLQMEGAHSGMKRRRPEETRRPGGGAGTSRGGHTDGEDGGLDGYERKPRQSSRPEWNIEQRGRLPLKMSDGSLHLPEPRMRRPKKVEAEVAEVPVAAPDSDEDVSGSDAEYEKLDAPAAAPKSEEISAGVTPKAGISSFAAWHAMSPREQLARREDLKVRIAELADTVISDPEHNVSEGKSGDDKVVKGAKFVKKTKRANTLLELHQMGGDSDPVIRRLAMLSCVMVFKDILPGYRIRLPTAAEFQMRVTKEVKKLRDFEAALLTAYQRFLKYLEITTTRGDEAARKLAKGELDSTTDTPAGDGIGFDADVHGDEASKLLEEVTSERLSDKEYARKKMEERRVRHAAKLALGKYEADNRTLANLGQVAVQCMCELLKGLPHFNFRANLVAFVAPRMSSRVPLVASTCCTAISDLFTSDTTCEASLEVVRVMNKIVKDASTHRAGFRTIHVAALETLLKLRLQAFQKAGRERALADLKMTSKKAKRLKAIDADDVLSGLKAADAEALEERRGNSTQTLRMVITLYFRVLKSPDAADLLPPVLQGLAKFAHMIDVSVVSDLLAALKELLTSSAGISGTLGDLADGGAGASGDSGKPRMSKLSTESSFNCALTALRIMAGPGELLNADETEFAGFLYGTLLRLMGEGEHVHTPLAVRAISHLLITRREYSAERVAAFVQRCLYVSLHLPPHASLALVSLSRQLMTKYPPVMAKLQGPNDRPQTHGATLAGLGAPDVMIGGVAMGTRSTVYDPDRAHALACTSWELALLQSHYHPAVRQFAQGGALGEPIMPSEEPERLYNGYNAADGSFTPALTNPKDTALHVKWLKTSAQSAKEAASGAGDDGGAKGSSSGGGKGGESRLLFLKDAGDVAPWFQALHCVEECDVTATPTLPTYTPPTSTASGTSVLGAGGVEDCEVEVVPPPGIKSAAACHFLDMLDARAKGASDLVARIHDMHATYSRNQRIGVSNGVGAHR